MADKTATKADEKKRVVAATVSPETFERLEDYRWQNRMSKADVVNAALDKFFATPAK